MTRISRILVLFLIAGPACTTAMAPPSLSNGDGDDASPSDTSPAAAPVQTPFSGIFVLGSSELNTLGDADLPFVDGLALRTAWTELDTGTTATGPVYDFSRIAVAIGELGGKNKKLTLGIDAQLVPDYVVDAAATTYVTTVPGPGHTSFPATTAVTWDASALAAYRALLSSLASFQVCLVGTTCAASSKVALKDHPALAGIRINILGMGKLRQDSRTTDGTIFEVPSYDRPTFIAAVVANLHAAQDRFPRTASWVPYFSVDDTVSGTSQTPPLDAQLIAAITTEFDGSSTRRPVIGVFEELLKGDTPPVTGLNGQNLVLARTSGSFVAFQACGGWINQSLCTFNPGDSTPQNGFDLGYGAYGTRYYELYTGDLNTPSFATMFGVWDAFLKAPSAAGNPVGLTAMAGAGTTNVLRWTDTSTIETGFVVERQTLPSGAWAPYGAALPPNTVSYTDPAATHAVSFAYRVHAVGTAGDFVLSNEVVVAAH
jgi:hypothetical protein